MRCPRASCQRAVAHRRFAARAEGAGTPELASGMSETFLTLLCFWRGARVRALRCAEGARQRAAFLVLKAFPKGKACFQLEPRRRIPAPPPSDPSVLVATRQAFEHSCTDVPLRSSRRTARLEQYKSLHRAADIHAATDTENLGAFSRRPTTGILRPPTYPGANIRADRTTSKFSLPMPSGEVSDALIAESSALS